jgi:hypothetical protein
LTDASGRELAQNDDHADPGAGLETHHADSWLSATLAADGPVYLQISDTQGKGGPGHAYRLRISPPRPDFELRMVPSALNLRFGTTVPVTVYAVRRDGFAGDIALALKSAPAGFELGGARLPAGQDKIRFTLTAPAGLGPDPVRLQLEGRAMIEGHELRRPLVPADDVMQAFIYRHLVPARESILVLPRGARPGAAFRRLSEGVVRWPAGGSVVVPMAGPRRPGLNQWEFALSEPPDGVSIGDVTEAKGGLAIELKADASTTKPGLRGNLIVTAQSVRSREGKGAGEAPRRGGAAVVTLPAIPFEILETKK